MSDFSTKMIPVEPDIISTGGFEVRNLLELDNGGFVHFELAAGRTSTAVTHRTIEEIWFILGGSGEVWRKLNDHEEVTPLNPGVCITIPLGTHFQFRSLGNEPLAAVAVTIPPWPGEGEAYVVEGKWTKP